MEYMCLITEARCQASRSIEACHQFGVETETDRQCGEIQNPSPPHTDSIYKSTEYSNEQVKAQIFVIPNPGFTQPHESRGWWPAGSRLKRYLNSWTVRPLPPHFEHFDRPGNMAYKVTIFGSVNVIMVELNSRFSYGVGLAFVPLSSLVVASRRFSWLPVASPPVGWTSVSLGSLYLPKAASVTLNSPRTNFRTKFRFASKATCISPSKPRPS